MCDHSGLSSMAI